MQLTKNFALGEFACKCGCARHQIPEVLREVRRIAAILQRGRDHWGKPIHVLSGVRCANWNRRVGGAPASRHILGQASDILVEGVPVAEVEAWFFQQPDIGGCHGYRDKGFTHGDVRARVNGQIVTWEG